MLQEVDAQHGLERKRRPTALGSRRGRVRLDECQQVRPRDDTIHLLEKLTLARALDFAFKPGAGEAGLFHEQIVSGGRVVQSFPSLVRCITSTHQPAVCCFSMSNSLPVVGGTPAGVPDAQQPRLLDQVRARIRVKHYSIRTEEQYVFWTVNGRVAASTQNQALSALLFLYREVLEIQLPWLDNMTRAKPSQRLPVVLTPAEVRAVLGRMDGVHGHLPGVVATFLKARRGALRTRPRRRCPKRYRLTQASTHTSSPTECGCGTCWPRARRSSMCSAMASWIREATSALDSAAATQPGRSGT